MILRLTDMVSTDILPKAEDARTLSNQNWYALHGKGLDEKIEYYSSAILKAIYNGETGTSGECRRMFYDGIYNFLNSKGYKLTVLEINSLTQTVKFNIYW